MTLKDRLSRRILETLKAERSRVKNATALQKDWKEGLLEELNFLIKETERLIYADEHRHI